MASLQDELRDVKIKNNDLAKKFQYWKMLARQRQDEQLDLKKEIHELNLTVSRLRSSGNLQARKFEADLQAAAQQVLVYLVRASDEVATTIDLAKDYMRDRNKLDSASPRWSSIGGTPSPAKKDKVDRVPPVMIDGQSIQPVVALTMLDTSNALSAARSSSLNINVPEREVPMHISQDVHIPLTSIDKELETQNIQTEEANNTTDDNTEVIEIFDDDERELPDLQIMDEDEDSELTPALNAVGQDTELETDEETPPRSITSSNWTDKQLEGSSIQMLDASNDNEQIFDALASKLRANLEPVSTNELEYVRDSQPTADKTEDTAQLQVPSPRNSYVFLPTARRRKRPSLPPAVATPRRASPFPLSHVSPFSPRPTPPKRISNSGRVLKVLVTKMRLDVEGATDPAPGAQGSPRKRAATGAVLAAYSPSPNGATATDVIVSETSKDKIESLASGEPTPDHRHLHQHLIDDGADDMHWINIDRRTKTRGQNERMNNRDNNDQTKVKNVEEHQINVGKRTNDRGQTKRTNSKERRNIQISEEIPEEVRVNFERRTDRRARMAQNRERTREIQPSDSMEQNERTDSRERNKQTDIEKLITERGKQNIVSKRGNSAERSDRQTNKQIDRRNVRQEEVTTDSLASNDCSRQDDKRYPFYSM